MYFEVCGRREHREMVGRFAERILVEREAPPSVDCEFRDQTLAHLPSVPRQHRFGKFRIEL